MREHGSGRAPFLERLLVKRAVPVWKHPCITAFMIAVAGAAAADPKDQQCWECLQRLAMDLPVVNVEQDPFYELGLTPGSVLPALARCSLDDGEIPTLRQIIKVFADAQAEHGGAAYVR